MALPVASLAVRGGLAFLQTKTGRAIAIGLVLILLLVPLLIVGVGVGVVAAIASQQAAAVAEESDNRRCVDPPNTAPHNPTAPEGSDEPGGWDPDNLITLPEAGGMVIHGQTWDAEQVANMRVIIGVAKAIGFGSDDHARHAAKIGIATARQESTIRNLSGGDRDSVGMMQQRPSMGWGTVDQLKDPRYAMTAFYLGGAGAGNNGLISIQGWATMRVTDAAQAVQRSGFPEAYEPHVPLADAVLDALWSTTNPIEPWAGLPGPDAAPAADPGGDPLNPGGSNCAPGHGGIVVPSGEWTHPLPGVSINSTYRMRTNPATGKYEMHPGVDLPAACGTPIYAAKDGVVIHSGGPNEGNSGHLVEVDHGEGVSTRYVHSFPDGLIAQQNQQVKAGDVIAEVGADGNVTGCHLHFEVKVNGEKIDPVPFMEQAGVPMPVAYN